MHRSSKIAIVTILTFGTWHYYPINADIHQLQGIPRITNKVEKTAEEILLNRVVGANDTLFEKEAKKLFVQFLVAVAKENLTLTEPLQKPRDLRLQDGYQSLSQLGVVQGPETEDAYPQAEISAGELQQSQSQSQQFNPMAQQPLTPEQQLLLVQQLNHLQSLNVSAYPYPYPANPATLAVTKPPETLGEVDKLIQQIFRINVTGIIDQSLSLTGSNPVRSLFGGILKLVFCDPISRLLGRCRGNDTI